MTFTFNSSSCISLMSISKDIVKGMEWTKQDMIEKGLLTDETTFEEMANHAGRHVIISECDH